MPTKKPILQVVIEEDMYEKFREICNNENIKMSSKANELVLEYIKKTPISKEEQIKYYAEKLYNLTKESTP